MWTLRQWGIYALIAIAMFVAWGVLGKVVPTRPGAFKNIVALLQRRLAEKVLWTALSLSAGFCEEFVYRLAAPINGLSDKWNSRVAYIPF